jgi:hypothetical protein
MIMITAWWGLGYAALALAAALYAWAGVSQRRAARVTAHILAGMAAMLLWGALISRAVQGHGWPLTSAADRAVGIALLLLFLYVSEPLWSERYLGGFAVTATSVMLLSYGLGRYPQGMVTLPIVSAGTLVSSSLDLLGGSLLALAACLSLSSLIRLDHDPPNLLRLKLVPEPRDVASETLVRSALFCLAVSLAIDTWWLQKVGLGSTNDAQQAGIAIAWMIYFVSLRLRSSARWRGWPWTAVLAVGFICTLPILVQATWLEKALLI